METSKPVRMSDLAKDNAADAASLNWRMVVLIVVGGAYALAVIGTMVYQHESTGSVVKAFKPVSQAPVYSASDIKPVPSQQVPNIVADVLRCNDELQEVAAWMEWCGTHAAELDRMGRLSNADKIALGATVPEAKELSAAMQEAERLIDPQRPAQALEMCEAVVLQAKRLQARTQRIAC